MSVSLSSFARALSAETAFDVLAVAKRLKAQGKDVIELQIGDSPFPSMRHAVAAGLKAIQDGSTHYCSSPGVLSFRETVAVNYGREFGVKIGPENVVVAPGAKVFEQFFCEAFLDPGDAVLLFTPHFPTYGPNIERRGARVVLSPLRQANQFRPDLNDVKRFLDEEPRAKAIFLNSPHNPTGGVATVEDMRGLAELVRGRNVAVFSDEPYCHMVWEGRHETPLAQPGMIEQSVAAYTFSKSYSMSGWRLGYAVTSARYAEAIGKMINTSLSCTPPATQLAGQAALQYDAGERDEGDAAIPQESRIADGGIAASGRRTSVGAGRHFLCLSQRVGALSAVGNAVARFGDVSAGGGRRAKRRGVFGRRMFRFGGARFLHQLCRAGRTIARGRRFSRDGSDASRPGE